MRLKNKVAIITGAGSSIGRAIALDFLREGARVVAADRESEDGQGLAETLQTAGGESHFSDTDIAEEEQIQALVGDAVMAFGTIDILVNAATARFEGDALSLTQQDWKQSIAVNMDAAWLCARYAIPFMKSSGGGAIVNLTSTHADRTMPKRFAYTATRAALAAMTRSMAIDFGPHGIRANALAMGYIQSRFTERALRESADPERAFRRILAVHPMGRVGTADEVARAATFLASDDASFITGATLVVDGGRSVVMQDLYDSA